MTVKVLTECGRCGKEKYIRRRSEDRGRISVCSISMNSESSTGVSESPAMKSDSSTTVQYLKQLLRKFRDDRDWAQFHDPKSLAEAISIEASELLELFLWKSTAEVKGSIKSDSRFRKAVEEELADVFCFGLNLANAANIDMTNAIIKKIEINKKKYPLKKSKGTAAKYDKL